MNDAEFALLDQIEEDHWWFVGKRLLPATLLERHAPAGRLLDLGCGTGCMLREWSGSQHDETFEHRRRYTAASLVRAVRQAGLEPERMTYINVLLFPVSAVWRTLSYRFGLGRFAPKHDFWATPRWLNALLVQVYRLESWLLRRFDLPLGLSVVCIARAPRAG